MQVKSYTVLGFMVLVLAAAGCAKEEVVKKDEPVVQQQTVPQQPAQQPVAQPQTATTAAPAAAQQQQDNATAQKANQASQLETVYFDFDKSDLRKDTRDTLAKDAELLLKGLAGAKVQIEGHCDERGSDEYNLALGERRAKSVEKYLLTLGVAANHLSTISYGKEKPAVQGHDEVAWSKNRRAEFKIVQ